MAVRIYWPGCCARLVGGTACVAQLATFEEGEALGIFNGVRTAIAAVIAAFLAL